VNGEGVLHCVRASLADEAGGADDLFNQTQPARSGLQAALFRGAMAETDDESQPVLKVSLLDLGYQPLPVEVMVMDHQPRQSFDHANLQIVSAEGSQQDDRRVLFRPAAQLTKARIPEVGKGAC